MTTPLRQSLFEAVQSAGNIARVDLAKHVGVSPATVTTVVSELIAEGLLQEVETATRPNHRGRPPVALCVNPQAAYVCGIKFSEFAHTAVLTDLAGQVIAEATMERNNNHRTPEHVLSEAKDLMSRLLNKTPVDRSQIVGLGAGLPGIIDHPTGLVHWSPILSERNVQLAEMLKDALGLPTQVDNDVNLLTLAELWFGHGRKAADFVVITVEQGIGMGLALNHELYRGAHSIGMEFGHTKVQLDGALCRCGQRGCLEAYISDYALIREASTALDLNGPNVLSPQDMLESLFDHAKAGNEAARMIFSRAGRYMSMGLANIVNLFDPSLIILSGERMRYDYLYADNVITEMNRMTINTDRSPLKIETHAWGDLVWARGAAALAMSKATTELTARSE